MDKIKKINRITFGLLIFSFVVIFAFPSYSAKKDLMDEIPQMMCDQINGGVSNIITENLTSKSKVFKAFTTGKGQGKAKNIFKKIDTFMNWQFGLCGLAVVIMCFYRMFDNMNKGMDQMECIEKTLLDITLSMILLMYIPDLLGYIAEGGTDFINQLTFKEKEPFKGITCELLCGKEKPKGGDWFKCIAILLLPWAGSYLMSIAAWFVSFSMILEIGIRRTFSPIACVNMIGEGLRSPGVRYLKRYFGVFIKICMCLVIGGLVNACTILVIDENGIGNTEDLLAIFEFVITILALNFTAIGLMFKTGEFSNDVLGLG